MDIASLDGMKRAELQKLAKKAGIKANKKTEHLISELKKYYANGSNAEEKTCSQSGSDINSSQTETGCTTTATEFETATESEVETKSKVTRGRRGRKAAGRKKTTTKVSDSEADTTADEEALTQPPAEEPKQVKAIKEVVEADTETPSPPKRTRAKRGRRGRKRAATPSPIKEATPAKIAKSSPVQQKSVTPKPATPTAEDTKPDVTPPKSETPAPTAKTTPQNETESVPTTTGSTTRRSARKATTPVMANQAPTAVKSTPEVTKPDAAKPATRSSSGQKTSKKRRSTFEIDPVTGTPKPSSQEKEKVKAESNLKKKEIEKKDQEQESKQPSTRIPKPRFGKPLTPGNKNWAQIHAARMEKMESIDDYLERKRKRTENLCASVKRAKLIAEEAKAAMETLKAHRTPPVRGKQGPKIVKPVTRPGANFMSPRPKSKSALKVRKSGGTANFASPAFKGPASKTPAAPNTAAKSVSFKVSKLKTPKPAMSGQTSCQKRVSTPGPNRALPQSGRKSVGDAAEKRKSLMASARKSVGEGTNQRKSVGGATTPFKFGGNQLNTTTPAKKSTFDLKASLSKGLTYKPYTGKLKPLGDQNYHYAKPKTGVTNAKAHLKMNTSVTNAKPHLKMHANVTKAKAELKRPKVVSREERRAGAVKHRAVKRENNMMARRGIKI